MKLSKQEAGIYQNYVRKIFGKLKGDMISYSFRRVYKGRLTNGYSLVSTLRPVIRLGLCSTELKLQIRIDIVRIDDRTEVTYKIRSTKGYSYSYISTGMIDTVRSLDNYTWTTFLSIPKVDRALAAHTYKNYTNRNLTPTSVDVGEPTYPDAKSINKTLKIIEQGNCFISVVRDFTMPWQYMEMDSVETDLYSIECTHIVRDLLRNQLRDDSIELTFCDGGHYVVMSHKRSITEDCVICFHGSLSILIIQDYGKDKTKWEEAYNKVMRSLATK